MRYWTSLSSFGKAMHYLLLAGLLLFVVFNVYVSAAQADAPGPGYKDLGYSSDYRAEPTAYRRSDNIRDHLSAADRRELKRIHARTLRRMKADREDFARSIKRRRVSRYYDEPVRKS